MNYRCLFCGHGIAQEGDDPCALLLTARIDRPRAAQKEQIFYTHLACLRAKAVVHPSTFYLAEPDFATRGEVEAERRIPSEDVAALAWCDVSLRGIRRRTEDAGIDVLLQRPGQDGESCLRVRGYRRYALHFPFLAAPH